MTFVHPPHHSLCLRQFRVLGAVVFLVVFVLVPSSKAQRIFFETFDSLPLGAPVRETEPGGLVWTDIAPPDWTLDDSQVPGIGTDKFGMPEWAGWSFANKDWWIRSSGDQKRSEFRHGQGTILISDSDEWEDGPHPVGLLNQFITTPEIPLGTASSNTLLLVMDSSWRPEAFDDGLPGFPVDADGFPTNNQTAVLWASYNGGDPVQIMKFSSDPDSPDFHADGRFINEILSLPLRNPADATRLQLRFGFLTAANDWWWALDNITIGFPPFASAITNNGSSLGIRISEGLGKGIDTAKPIRVRINDQRDIPIARSRRGSSLWITHNRFPEVFPPRSNYVAFVEFATLDGRVIEEPLPFTTPGYVSVFSTPSTVLAVITETSWMKIDESKEVTLVLNGRPIQPRSLNRSGGSILADYRRSQPFFSGSSHRLRVRFFTTSGQLMEENLVFTVQEFPTLPPELATSIGSGTDPGMRWRTHQLIEPRGGTVVEAENQLTGALGVSIHNPSGQTDDGSFIVPSVNFDQTGSPAGHFRATAQGPLEQPDRPVPGIPGTVREGILSNDYFATECLTYVEFPAAGVYWMGVHCDDGFELVAGGEPGGPSIDLGSFNGERSAADSLFYLRIIKPGVYPFRLLWYETTGASSIEWFTLDLEGNRALVGGSQPDSLRAYISRVFRTGLHAFELTPDGQITVTFTGRLSVSDSLKGPFVPVEGAVSPTLIDPRGRRMFFRADADP
ncbi:MAG: hypothetical protein FJ405_01105 [Verrucomicrobia bacterium]|nr:hypothetical protein [Verrucomicrobiota bacterium]